MELTQIVCLDPPIVSTAAGVVHATPSDAPLAGRLPVQNRHYATF